MINHLNTVNTISIKCYVKPQEVIMDSKEANSLIKK